MHKDDTVVNGVMLPMMDARYHHLKMEPHQMTKTTLRTVLNNVIAQDVTFTYDQQLVWSKWIVESNPKPQPFMSVVQEHLSHNLNTSDSSSECEIPSDKPRDKESI